MLFFIPFAHFFRDHAFQKKAEIPPIDPAIFGPHLRQAEGALFQTLIPDGQTVAVPIKQFNPVAVAVTKYKQRTGQGILGQFHSDQSAQAIKGLSHIAGGPVQIDPGGGG
jgi:hypothetical protein